MDHVIISVRHPGSTAAICAIRPGTVHQLLLAEGHQPPRPLEHLPFNGTCSAKGPARPTVSLQRHDESIILESNMQYNHFQQYMYDTWE